MKYIKYYRTKHSRVECEYVHPDCLVDGKIITALTGRKTIDDRIRGLITDLSAGDIQWEEVLAPGFVPLYSSHLDSGKVLGYPHCKEPCNCDFTGLTIEILAQHETALRQEQAERGWCSVSAGPFVVVGTDNFGLAEYFFETAAWCFRDAH